MRPSHSQRHEPAPGWPEFWDLYYAGKWEPDTYELLRDLLRPDDLLVDVGAWIGPVSLWALELDANVIAIEPDPVARMPLHRNLSAWPRARWEIWPCAITPASGVDAWLSPSTAGTFGTSESSVVAPASNTIAVQARSLPDIIGDRDARVAVIDIEGYEAQLMPTLGPWLVEHGAACRVSLHGRSRPVDAAAWFPGARNIHETIDRDALVMLP
ncbi:MAG: FkbM family methyltransferase [Solirubrobacteraceae bacterium]|nr:FkbM family methyltransferase [Solirubrobacteraceae bacterium]